LKRLKALLDRTSEKRSAALLRFAHIVLQAIRSHAIQSDDTDYQNFSLDIQALETRLGAQPDAAEALVVAGAVAKAIHDYNRRANAAMHLYRVEYENIVSRLTQAIAAISSGSALTITRLEDTHRQLQKAAMIEDVRTLKARLEHCLELLEEETVRQRREAADTLGNLQQLHPQKQTAPPPRQQSTETPITTVASPTAIENAIHSAFVENRRTFAAVFVIERLNVIIKRFGSHVGDQVQAVFLDHLKHHLSSADTIYSWCDPVFVALLERPYGLARVQEELARVSTSRPLKALTLETRSVLLPISTAWTVVDILESSSPHVAYQQIGLFADRHYPHKKWALEETDEPPACDYREQLAQG
jgi:GGDEF domain-containing protein